MSTKKTARAVTAARASVADHLSELRMRLTWVAVVFVVLSSLAYTVREQLVSFVLQPLGDQKLIYLTPAGGFTFIFLVTMYAGALLTAPLAVYHIYRFISPAMPIRRRRYTARIIIASTLMLLLGAGFGYFVAIPAALSFLTAFAGSFVQPNLTADSYLNFVVAYVMGLGILFQLPLLLILWNWARPFQKGELIKTQQYVFIGSFIAAAIITPTPDVLNQCLIALPIIVVYQLGVMTVYFANRRSRRASQRQKPRPPVHTEQAVPVIVSQALPRIAPPIEVAAPVMPVPTLNPQRQRQPVVSVDGMRRISSPARPTVQLSRVPHAGRHPVHTAPSTVPRRSLSIDGLK